MRVFLAVLLVLTSFPAQAADPLVELLVTHRAAAEPFEDASASDAREAAGEPDPQTLDLGRLTNLQSGLSMMAQGIEAFRHPSHYAEAHKVLMKRLPPEVQPYYEDRDRGLDTLYRTLALVDYTAALRYEAPPCEARELRRDLLHSGDGLFVDPKTGRYSPWLKSILKRAQAGPASATERASATAKLEGVAYDQALARVRSLGDALQDPGLEAEKRAESYCARAAIYESLAAAHRRGGDLVEAGRTLEPSARFSDALAAVGAVTGPRGTAAATILDVFGRKVVVTSARMLLEPETGLPAESVVVEFREGGPREGRVKRWDLATDLAMLEVDAPGLPLVPKQTAPHRADRVYAVGHPEQGGRWSVTQGLVTRTTAGEFQTDALIATGLAGGPVLDEEGGLVGISGARMKADGSLEPGVAVKAAVVHDWTYEKTEDLHESAEEVDAAIDDWGTGSILTAASTSIAPEGAPIEAGIQGVCVAYCDGPPSSSRSGYSGGSSGGGEAIVGMAMVLGVAVAGVGYLIWQGLKALAKSLPKASVRSASAARVERATPKTKAVSPKPTPPPKPKPKLSIEWEAPGQVSPGSEQKVTVRVKSEPSGANLEGIPIEVSVSSRAEKVQLKTDRDGTATFILKVSTEQEDFEDLRRQSQLIVSAAPLFPVLALAGAAGGSLTLVATVTPFALAAGGLVGACVIYVVGKAAWDAVMASPPNARDERVLPKKIHNPAMYHAVQESAGDAHDSLRREAASLEASATPPEDPDDEEDENCSGQAPPAGLAEFEKAAAGKAGKRFTESAGGRERAKDLFRQFDVKGSGQRLKLRDTSGGGRSVAGEMADGTPIRIRFKPDGTTRIQVGCKKFVFPEP